MSKTGTTSLTKAFRDLGYRVASEHRVSHLFPNYAMRDFGPIIKFCRHYQVFEDHLFGLPYTFQALDHAYPGSKFILSVRDSADTWYHSYINHHIQRYGMDGKLPTRKQYKALEKIPGLNRWDYEKIKYYTPADDIFDKEALKKAYVNHIETVLDYFRYRKEDLLVINLAEEDSYTRFCEFLDVEPLYERFPHLNKGENYTNSNRKFSKNSNLQRE